MKVVYVGMHKRVLVPEAGYLDVKRGEPVEIEDSIAERLLIQGGSFDEEGRQLTPGTEWKRAAEPRAPMAKAAAAEGESPSAGAGEAA